MRTIRITITADVDDHATDEDIAVMVGAAYVQVNEPADLDGEDAEFATEHVSAYWDERSRTDAILDVMRANGLAVSWDYPGMAVLTFNRHGRPHQVATGLNGWEYGSMSVLTDDGWEPTDEPAEPAITETETDPNRIANAWTDWVRTNRN